jgi:hypothetical protein
LCAGYKVVAARPEVIKPENGWAYDATLLCLDGNVNQCPGGAFRVWAQSKIKTTYWGECADTIGRFVPGNAQSPADGYKLEAWEFPVCDRSTALCDLGINRTDAFAGPDLVQDGAGRQFLVFSHGSADIYNGLIQFKSRSGPTAPWSQPINLFRISTQNITDCFCYGGFARVAAIDMPGASLGDKSYMYFYVEVWAQRDQINSGKINWICPSLLSQIGWPAIFLVRVEKSTFSPYLSIQDGKAQMCNYSEDQKQCAWVNLPVDQPQQDSISDPPSLYSGGYVLSWNNWSQYYTTKVLDLSLGDVFKDSNGNIIALLGISSPDYKDLVTRISADGIFFEAGNSLQDFEAITGLLPKEYGLSSPTFYRGGVDYCARPWYYLAYSHIPGGDYNNYDQASIKFAVVEPAAGCPPLPYPIKPPFFKGLIATWERAYVDQDGDGAVDADILASWNLMHEVGYQDLRVVGGQEEGYDVMLLAVACHEKNKNKVECSSEEADLPGLMVDTEGRVLYLLDGYFDPGDTVDVQVVLRAYDKIKDDKDKVKKPKKCKKEDKCVRVKIRVVD